MTILPQITVESTVAIEQSFDVDSMLYKGISIWPLIRLAIIQQLMNPNGNFTRQLSGNSDKIQILSIPENQKELLKAHKDTDILFFPYEHTEKPEQVKGKFYQPFTDSMIDLIRNTYSFLKVELASDRIQQTLPRYEQTIFVSPILLSYEADTAAPIKNFSDFQQVVWDIAKIRIDESLVISQVQTVKAWKSFFSEILSEVLPKAVFFVFFNHIIAMALIKACKELNIISADIQHGRIDRHNPSYVYWMKIPQAGYDLIPDYLWCWGTRAERIVEECKPPASNHHIPLVGGDTRILKWFEEDFIIDEGMIEFYDRFKRKDKVILITVSYDPLPEFICDAMHHSPSNWLWLIRCHPYCCSEDFKMQIRSVFQQYSINNYEIECATSFPLYGLLKRVNHHITIESSACYEALAFNVPSTVASPVGFEVYKEDIERGAIAYADNSELLLSSINEGISKLDSIDLSEYTLIDKRASLEVVSIILNRSSQKQGRQVIGNSYIMNQFGCKFFYKGYKKASLNSLLRAVEINPELSIAYNNIGVWLCHAHETNKSLQYFAKALEISPDDQRITTNVIEVLRILGNVKKEGTLRFILEKANGIE